MTWTLFGRLGWRWVGWKVPHFGFAHVGGRRPSDIKTRLSANLLVLSFHMATRPTNTFRLVPNLHCVLWQQTVADPHTPRCASAFCGFPLSFLGMGTTR